MTTSRRTWALGAAALVVYSAGIRPASGHPDYEDIVTTLPDGKGRSVDVVLHFRDGIVATDPVKLVLYDMARGVRAETPYFRDVILFQGPDGRWHAFGVEMFTMLYGRSWVISGDRLVEIPFRKSWPHALWGTLRNRWPVYLITVQWGWIVALMPTLRRRFPKIRKSFCDWVGTIWIVWMLLVFMYGRQSLPLALAIVVLGKLVIWVCFRPWRFRPATPGNGP